MEYEPIKKSLGRCFTGPLFLGKSLYFLLDLLLLRSWHVRKALKKITLLFPGEANFLDAGSGLGQYTWGTSRMNKGWTIKGLDINSQHVEDCTRFFKKAGLSERVSFQTADLISFSERDRYDIILSVDVMEHIKEDEVVFKNLYNSLKKNGLILISTPSDQGGSDVHDDNESSFIDEHVRNGYGIGEITEKLTSAGFRNIKATYTYGKPGNISWHISIKYPVRMLNISRLFFIILPFYYMIFFPVSVILNIFDLNLIHKTGTGLLVMAEKQER